MGVERVCEAEECDNYLIPSQKHYCSDKCYKLTRFSNPVPRPACICLCGCGGQVTRLGLTGGMYATKKCKKNKPKLVECGIIPEYRRSKLEEQIPLKVCGAMGCENKVRNNTKHYCSRKCQVRSVGRVSLSPSLQEGMRKLMPDGYLNKESRWVVFDRASEGDVVAIGILSQLGMTRLFHKGIWTSL